ncbi:MAG: hypothetical protein KGY75_04960, partial [Candidatus Cloacimonetes bacterium]|nr:hypothetical protein [Candidatus Cloacimonadota bacterium]
MIENFLKIGEILLQKDNYYETENDFEKRKKLLFYQSLVPRVKIKKEQPILNGKALVLNFDLKNNHFKFKLSNIELDKDNRRKLLAFKLGAPRDKKKFFATNNISAFYDKTYVDSLKYIEDKRNKNKSKEWFNKNVSVEYDKFLEKILNKFYSKIDGRFYLDYNLLESSQKIKYKEIEKEYSNKKLSELYDRLINKIFFNSDSKNNSNFPYINFIKFNNKTIFDFKDGKYANDYINICYYDLLKRFSTEKSKNNKLCHLCNNRTRVIQDLPLTMKFYGTTNSLNFEQVSSSNAYKSFALCENCLFKVLTGMKFVQNTLSDFLFNINVYLIPKNVEVDSFDSRVFRKIIKLLKTNKSEYKNEIDELKALLKTTNRKNLVFDFLFYYHPPGSQQFDILKLISNIELNKLLHKLNYFDKISEKYDLQILSYNASLTINDLRYYLFPSWFSLGKNPEYNIFGKDLINLLEKLLTNGKISYNNLINKFTRIFKKRVNRDKIDKLSAFKMNLFFGILQKTNQLRIGGNMTENNYISEITKKEYKDFFETHSNIYGTNSFRQGLFLLGTIISKIQYAQKDKSSNFLKKVNLGGIPPRRITQLINQVKEFTNIYHDKIYLEPGIW